MSEESKNRIIDPNEWLRLLFMLLYAAVVFYVIKFIVTVILIIQFLSRLITGAPLERLRKFSAQVSAYGYEIFQYVSYNSDDKPFPFSDWPSGLALQEASAGSTTTGSSEQASSSTQQQDEGPQSRDSEGEPTDQ
ncbi:MAG: DUF4389 domain-containing protein [Gammaproteobacteria bacterium]|nr:DUF4389 domain-containing protein [Gammaproteobacteria bacterium]